jgi:hypothetical protein
MSHPIEIFSAKNGFARYKRARVALEDEAREIETKKLVGCTVGYATQRPLTPIHKSVRFGGSDKMTCHRHHTNDNRAGFEGRGSSRVALSGMVLVVWLSSLWTQWPVLESVTCVLNCAEFGHCQGVHRGCFGLTRSYGATIHGASFSRSFRSTKHT